MYVYLWKVQQNVVGVIRLYCQQMKLFVSWFLFPCGFSDNNDDMSVDVWTSFLNPNDVQPFASVIFSATVSGKH